MILSGVSLHFLSAPKEAKAFAPLVVIGGIALWQWAAAAVLVAGTAVAIWYSEGPKFVEATLGAILSWISGAIFSIVSIFLTISGKILDYTMEKTVSGEFFNISAINTGWAVSRDVANLFFIFILLYIAIATILQLSSYGMKALLAKLVIIALLVNFSLVITKVIIDASNILAREFYSQLKVETIAPTDAPAGMKDINGNPVSSKKGDPIVVNSPSLVFMNAIQMQTIFTPDKFKTLVPGAGEQQKGDLNNFKITMIYLGGTIVVLVTTFVFFAMAILLVIRVVMLIILMILAPLAFLFMILPKTQQYANQWWDALFKQSFFAPALMFLVYLSASIISDPKFAQITDSEKAKTAFADAFSGNPTGFGIIFSFIIIIVLMVACLMVAQKMGAVGAGTMQTWGKAAGKWGRGVAGRATRRIAIARPMRAVAESKWAQRLASGPLSRWGGAAMIRTAQKGAKVGGLDKITEAKVVTGMGLPPEERARYLQNANQRIQEEMYKRMSARARVEAQDIGGAGFASTHTRLMSTLSAEEREKTEKTRKEVERKNIVNNIATSVSFATDIKLVKPDEVADLDKSIATDPAKISAILATISDVHLKKIEDRGDELSDAVIEALYKLDMTGTKSAADIAMTLRHMGNNNLARLIETGPVRARLGLT